MITLLHIVGFSKSRQYALEEYARHKK